MKRHAIADLCSKQKVLLLTYEEQVVPIGWGNFSHDFVVHGVVSFAQYAEMYKLPCNTLEVDILKRGCSLLACLAYTQRVPL